MNNISEIPLSVSPFLDSPIMERAYATNPDAIESAPDPIPEVESKPIPESDPSISGTTKKKVVISAPPPDPVDNTAFEADPEVKLFEYEEGAEPAADFMETPEPEVEGLEEAEMSTVQARETAKAMVMVFNQLFTIVGNSTCLLDEDSIAAAIVKGEIPPAIQDWAKQANERNKAAIPFDDQQQKELVRALIIILKESNFTALTPTQMAIMSILTVLGMQIKTLVDIRKSNKELLEQALAHGSSSANVNNDSTSEKVAPEPEPVKEQEPIVKEKKSSNNQQKVA